MKSKKIQEKILRIAAQEKILKRIIIANTEEQDPPLDTINNIKYYAEKNAKRTKRTSFYLLPSLATGLAALFIAVLIFSEFKVGMEINIHEAQVVHPQHQAEYIMKDVFSEDDLIFQYAIMDMI